MAREEALAHYYSARVREYERIYAKPERQEDLRRLREVVSDFATDRRVLELACGTGYWTREALRTAAGLTATDVSDEVLRFARAKKSLASAHFVEADAFGLDQLPGDYDAALAGFWWSHVPLSELPRFLHGLHARLGIGAQVLFFDNRYVEGSSTPLSRTDDAGNTYQTRALDSGDTYEVIKNFPTAEELRRRLEEAGGRRVEVTELTYFWHATYEVGRDAGARVHG